MFGEVRLLPRQRSAGPKLVKRLPKFLTEHFRVIILADTANGCVEFLHGVRKLKFHAVTGVAIDRKLLDGRVLRHLHETWATSTLSRFEVSCYCLLVLSQARQGKAREAFCFVY